MLPARGCENEWTNDSGRLVPGGFEIHGILHRQSDAAGAVTGMTVLTSRRQHAKLRGPTGMTGDDGIAGAAVSRNTRFAKNARKIFHGFIHERVGPVRVTEAHRLR